jgi:hypothetical protein
MTLQDDASRAQDILFFRTSRAAVHLQGAFFANAAAPIMSMPLVAPKAFTLYTKPARMAPGPKSEPIARAEQESEPTVHVPVIVKDGTC